MNAGQVLASCGVLGLDWERTSLSMYLEACEAHNASDEPEREPLSDDFKAWMKARLKRG